MMTFEIKNERFPLELVMANGSGRATTDAGVLNVVSKEDFLKKNLPGYRLISRSDMINSAPD